MRTLRIDIETYSDVDIKNGVYRYVDTDQFEVLLFAYSIDGQEVQCVDLTAAPLPLELAEALSDPSVIKVAFNAQFERVCLGKMLGRTLDPAQWRCTMVHAQQLGLPASLERCAGYLDLEQQKDAAGKMLIKYFSLPCKPTQANDMRRRNLPEHDPDKWQRFISYCIDDVKTEMAISEKLDLLPMEDAEWVLYALDQRINDRGVGIDAELVRGALQAIESQTAQDTHELSQLTGLDNPNSVQQLTRWLRCKGVDVDRLTKDSVKELLKTATGDVKRVLELRVELSKASTKKYDAMARSMCADGRVRGLLQFYGASRTGRWAGRIVQVQNLARNYLDDLETARDVIKTGDAELITMLYDSVSDTLKQLVRTALIAKDGCQFHVSDFSAIEARVIAWYAGERWVLDVFKTHGKLYEATADRMFHLGGIENVTKDLRQRGKVATLALGYQGGAGALTAMGAVAMGVKEEELQPLVDAWRKANKRIVKLWRDVEDAAVEALETKRPVRLGKLTFYWKRGFLLIKLPSGRRLAYAKARLVNGKYGPQIEYDGQGDKSGFTTLNTYGGKLVENIVQATARDVLAEAMKRLDAAGYPIVFHVHDEVVAECSGGSIEEMNQIMSITPEWADGLPLSAEGYITKFYKKD